MIDLEKMEGAMAYLAQTDLPYAEAKTDLLRSEILAKRSRARIFMTGDGPVEARKAAAEAHSEAQTVYEALIRATLTFETLKARRQRSELVIEGARTLEASRRGK